VTRKKYYIDKRCTEMGGSKIAKEPNEEKKKALYNISKDQSSKIGQSKKKGLKKPS
jgi:hypothetical protein